MARDLIVRATLVLQAFFINDYWRLYLEGYALGNLGIYRYFFRFF